MALDLKNTTFLRPKLNIFTKKNDAFASQIQAKNGSNFQEKAAYGLLSQIQAPL